MKLRVYRTLSDLPQSYVALFQKAGRHCVFQSLWWYECLLAETTDPGDQIIIYGVEESDPPHQARAILVARTQKGGFLSGLKPRRLAAFSNFYTIRAGPVLDPAFPDNREVLQVLAAGLLAERPAWDMIAFDYLDGESQAFKDIYAAFEAHGARLSAFARTDVWYEEIKTQGFAPYLEKRSGLIRKTLAWKNRKLDRDPAFQHRLSTGPEGLDEAIAAYEKVYAQSWKEPEFYPGFIPALIRRAAQHRALYLGTIFYGDEPLATQLSLKSGDILFQYKMAYDDSATKAPALRNLSLGALTIFRLLNHVLDHDHEVRAFDFGIGDEAYKAGWCSQRRSLYGMRVYHGASLYGRISYRAMRLRGWLSRLRRQMMGGS
ncbi:hypothetical protein JCM17846_25380 [Iodidimonas nitroreducens]|uniref:BioF2-like acetyltransferase domain-containing protein n=1 Tax=Iodidimonas nitroreducens TaxID=1236968 RepID=A0A5A7ND46_9PROT|nr:GNAT family N-acetyltransferase [Iodidimonas nitroreducens]GAK32251.1 putative protein [alpha proteobacterium Q-1]GER04856.1 hypothetical protein JCM17846_25380 [Iodidimonas nitroreducens]